MLAGFGIRVPTGQVVGAPGVPDTAAEMGFPVVLKSVARHLTHKSGLGAVAFPLEDPQAVASAVDRIRANVAGIPEAGERFLLERVVDGAVAALIAGVKRDPRSGLAVVIGSGGRLVSLVDGSRTLLLPTDRHAVARALDSLKVAGLMHGYRGRRRATTRPPWTRSWRSPHSLSTIDGRLLELDVNPLLVLPRGKRVVAADATLWMREA